MEKIIVKKRIEYTSNLNFIHGQLTRDGTLLIIESQLDELDFFQRPVPKNDWIIKIIKGESIDTVELKNVPLIPTKVDLFSDGTLLIVQGRCLKDGDYIERNARRYNVNGQLIDAFSLGDGISDMQIDETDTIWVSYFDEGIFGNFGWDQPMGSAGVVAYTMNGQRIWDAGNYGIIDSYALNVSSSKEVYFYYYDDFYLVHLSEMKEVSRYRLSGKASMEQFIWDETGLIGQIDRQTLMRYHINYQTLKWKEKIQLIDENGKRMNGPLFMRGNYLMVYDKEAIYERKE